MTTFETTHPTQGFDITVICDEENQVQRVIDSLDNDDEIELDAAEMQAIQSEADNYCES